MLGYETVNGRKVCSYEGKPLQGLCKIKFIDIDFAARSIATYTDGVQGDTVCYRTADSDVLLSRQIRLGEGETLVTEYYGTERPRSEYRIVDGKLEGVRNEWYPDGTPYLSEEYSAGALHGVRTEWDEQRYDARLTHLAKTQYEALEKSFCDSKYFDRCDIEHPQQSGRGDLRTRGRETTFRILRVRSLPSAASGLFEHRRLQRRLFLYSMSFTRMAAANIWRFSRNCSPSTATPE